MKRYYICDVITRSDPDLGTVREPAVASYPVNWSAVISDSKDYALVVVAAKNHAPLLADSRIRALPDFPLDAKVQAMQAATKSAMRGLLSARGVPTSVLDNADGYRDAIRGIGRVLDNAFDENNFDAIDG